MAKIVLQNVFPGSERIEIGDREFAVVTGPRGSGKTTLLRLLAGLERTERGEIFFDEKPVAQLEPAAREVAMVFAAGALYPTRAIRESIVFGLRARKFSSSEVTRRVEDAASVMGIAEILDRRPGEVSGEEALRAEIARAIARQPRVILFDDALAQLEGAARTRLRAELRQLHERLRVTFVYATRDPEEAWALGERVLVLQAGKVEQNDLLATVYREPANLFVAGFFGVPPMNLIAGTLKMERENLLFRESGEGTIELRLPRAERPKWEEWAGRPVVLGVRAGEIEIIEATKGQEPANSFPALVDFTEWTGAGMMFHLQTGAHALVAQGRGELGEEPAGRRVRCVIAPVRVQLFDGTSGERIAAT